MLNRKNLRHPKHQFGIKSFIVIPWENIVSDPLRSRKPYHFRVTCPGNTAVRGIGHAEGGNNRYPTRTLHHNWAIVHAGKTNLLSFVGRHGIKAFQYAANEYLDI